MEDKNEIVIECKEGKMDTKWDDVAEVLKDIKDCNITKVIYLSPHTSDLGKQVLKENNIKGLRPNELRSYLNGI